MSASPLAAWRPIRAADHAARDGRDRAVRNTRDRGRGGLLLGPAARRGERIARGWGPPRLGGERTDHDQAPRRRRGDDQAIRAGDVLILRQVGALRDGHEIELDHAPASGAVVYGVISDIPSGIE